MDSMNVFHTKVIVAHAMIATVRVAVDMFVGSNVLRIAGIRLRLRENSRAH